ncbi:hypothetical protein J3A84_05495 [Proteiniclasticum sp. SCR006]|uniref:Uncharacterized protein n=1 Tax=Proteiniclasticum aestuarii TaxID=2817862 RepID=A0A939KIU0_9CLOT|nr:hypothetical protein [Proteiniclasticum aestuarii]MBO1264493.1 hypothetical protein [Proteiniclasticum aestuarii]
MIFEIHDEKDIEKVKKFLEESAIVHDVRDSSYDSWDGVNIYDTLTSMFGDNPTLDGNEVVDLVYQRVPSMVERLNEIAIHDFSNEIDDSPYLAMEGHITDYYTKFIEEELQLMVNEGIIEIEEEKMPELTAEEFEDYTCTCGNTSADSGFSLVTRMGE